MADQKILRIIATNLKGPRWEINRLTEWDVTIDIATPANRFVVDIANPTGNYTELLGWGDKIELVSEFSNGSGREVIQTGYIDDIEEVYSVSEGGGIRIDCRDSGLLLIENDAIPITHKKISLKDLATKIFKECGLAINYKAPTIMIDKKQIRIGENGWDTIEEHALENDLRIWRIDNTYFLGKFQPWPDVVYTFADKPTGPKEIPILSIRKKTSGANRKSEIWAYRTGKKKGLVKEVDKTVPDKLKRRMVMSGAKTVGETKKMIKRQFARNKIGTNEVEIVLKGTRVVRPGRKANIIKRLGVRGFNLQWVISSVRYSCSVQNGEITTITCRPLEEVLG
ncbi:hypothetical protein [Brevibacillus sp. VP]|uniref:hypothetical protein n=1 Tax=unclassified Brevibacillus TaxID=2684853 RepID=UPI000E2E5B0B|nr:hypothetical protein [Brevibacillus sp. VP]RFB33424.1 hypothetical protein DZB91_14460 [Brevibacillus sp. VP]